jgi:hypothetical protein
MYHSDLYVAEKSMHQILEERRTQHDERRRVRAYISPALGWLGSRLVAWGSHLQKRYSAVATTPQPANRPLN